MHGLSQQHDIARQLIRISVGELDAEALGEDVQSTDLKQEYEAKVAVLERLIRWRPREVELLTRVLKLTTPPRMRAPPSSSGRQHLH